jgi:RNA polymerase-binding transcription factor DksA
MFTPPEVDMSRHRLLALLQRLDRRSAGLRAEAFGPDAEEGGGADLPHRPDDQGGVCLEDEVTLGLLENEENLVAQIQATLQRLDRGTYGRCEGCDRAISLRRLQAIPYTPHCIHCARIAQS